MKPVGKKRVSSLVLVLLICGAGGAAGLPRPGAQSAQEAAMDIRDYARLCRDRVGEIPAMDYRRGEIVPITVDGEVPSVYQPNMSCDRPSLLPTSCDGVCTPYTRLLRLRDDAEAQMVVMFRRKIIRPADSYLFDEIDLIVHNVANGDTCWFQASADNPDCDPDTGLDGRNVPQPDSPRGARFWNPPTDTVKARCGHCHDNDPFYYSPYVAQVTSQLPANPFGKYNNSIGPFKAWPKPMSITTRGNTCIGCHRIGVEYTCREGILQSSGVLSSTGEDELAESYPYSHWMPPHNFWTKRQWDVIYQESVELLRRCCEDHDAEGCTVTPIKGGSR